MNAKKWIVSIAIAFLLVSTFFSNIVFNGDVVSAHSGDVLIAWASVIPIIDGVISPAEWDDADSVSFLLEYSDLLPETVAHEATVYVKNDETYLYLAVVVKGDDFNPNDFGNWRFDNDNNGVIEVGDDGLSIRSDGLSTDRYRTEAIEGWWSSDVYDGGTNDIVGEVSHTNPSGVGDYTFEYRHPLDTADNGHDFSLKPGETVGFQLRYADGGPGGGGDEWPEPPDYGDIVIAEPDTAPPEIVEGPGVSAITANSALISWETDEDSDSVVKYDKASRKYDFEKKDSKMVRNHRITLADLEPSTVYHFMIQSADSAGNTVESRDKIFETLPLLDEEDPSVFIEDPGICNGITEIVAPAFDNIGVERVEFYLEDELMFIDYSSPFVFHLDTFGLENGLYSLKAKAFDFAGRIEIDVQDVEIFNPLPDFDNPSVLITYPSQGDTVSGIVEVQIHAVDTYKENEQQPVSRLEIYIDDALRHSINLALFDWHVPPHWVPEPEHPFDYRYYWDTRTVENGEHFITAIAYDDEENFASHSRTVTVDNPLPPPRPILQLTRGEVTRHGNYFTVGLDVENVGTLYARNIVVTDTYYYFQCVSEATAEYDVVTSYLSGIATSCVEITCNQPLAPGESCDISLRLIPILVDVIPDIPSFVPRYAIGGPTSVTYEDSIGNSWTETFSIPASNPPVNSAFSHADYLIVTSPDNLFAFNPAADVNNLLSAMAELAMLKNGVLGYFTVPASVHTSFDEDDGLACGDVDGDGFAEIIVAKTVYFTGLLPFDITIWRGWIHIYSATGREYSLQTSFDEDDGLACGDVDGDGFAEIIVAEDNGGLIDIYNTVGLETSVQTSFDEHDGLACGDVDGDGFAEIIVAEDGGSREGWIDIYNVGGLKVSIHSNFDEHDGLACGDVDGDGFAEIIVAEHNGGLIDIYNTVGLETSVQTSFDEHDGLACGAEIIVAEDGGSREGWIDIYNVGGLKVSIHSNFDVHDGLACGDVDGDGFAEVMVAEDGGMLIGWVDVISPCSFTGDSHRLHDLITEGGDWSSQLRSDWTSNGYLLIVGETEIVPSWASWHDVTFLDRIYVRCTDLKYANTADHWIKPELSIGRIIGDNASALMIPIQTSIDVHNGQAGYEFDRSDILVVSGWPRCLSGTCDDIDFAKEARDVASILRSGGTFDFHMNMPDYGTDRAATNAFFNVIGNPRLGPPDIIHLAGHGTSQTWDVISAADVSDQINPFGGARPFVYASSCSTGKYWAGFSIAEAFLSQGAAVYIGATEDTFCCMNTAIAKDFYRRWDPGESIGLAFKQSKRAIADGFSSLHPYSEYFRGFCLSAYQLYGDPKYGWQGPLSATGAAFLAQMASLEPLSSLDVVVPDYEVTTIEGKDYVEIPGGDILDVPDTPLVPFYTVSLDYPKGYEVWDVILTNRSGLTTATGLNIPNAILAIAGDGGLEAVGSLESLDWWPEEVFGWAISENPDGSTTLVITMCPFYYNPQTTDVKFYKNYSFDIYYTVSTVEITKLETDKHVYEAGEQVLVDLELNNSAAEANDILVETVIKAESTGEIVDGLLLRTLKNLTGLASFSPQWNSMGFEPGYYYLEATLKDTSENVLDRKSLFFRLGAISGEVTSFIATPEYFDIGDDVEISMTFNNTGAENITGVAVARIANSVGHLVEEFTHDITDLKPSESISFSAAWDTSEAEEGSYNVVGYVLYDGKASAMASTVVQTSDLTPSLDTTPPTISIVSPENKTYSANTVPLTLTVDEATSWSGYSLDGQANVTITENATLSELSDGSHSLIVYAKDVAGNTGASEIVYFSIDSTLPIADAGSNKEVNVDTLVTFDASSSTDNVAIVSYEWDFGDGTTDTGTTCNHTYTEPGNYTVTLTVKDAAGNLDTDTINVTVTKEAPNPFPWWILGVTAAVVIVIVAVTILWTRRKKP